MKKTLEDFLKLLPKKFLYISGFDNGMQSKVKIKNIDTGKIHNIIAENYIYLNSESNRFSEKMIIKECIERGYTFIKRDKNKILINKDKKDYSVYLSNFMKHMDPQSLGNKKKINTKIENSRKRFKEKSIRTDINNYEILEFSGMKKPMKVRYIPTGIEIDIPNPQIFSKGGYQDFPWNNEIKRKELEDIFLKKFNEIKDREFYELNSNFKYVNNKTKIEVLHKICNKTFLVRPDFFLNQGTRCPFCALKGKSSQEDEVYNFILSIYSGKIERNYKLPDGTEIDILFSNLNIGIEYNGLYWHSEQNGKSREYHITKTNNAAKEGIRLIHIFEDEWIYKNKIVKSKIIHILGLNKNQKIYARKCKIQQIDSKTKDFFLENNHIQGSDKSKIRLGLFYNNLLVSVMTFSKPRVALGQYISKQNIFELVRYAADINYLVIGGFGKLLTYFKENYKFEKIITYADLRWSTKNNLYESTGFIEVRQTEPNYWYSDRHHRYHRYGFRKQLLSKLFPDLYDSSLTEFEIMNQTNYYRIWDCGNLVYELNKEITIYNK